MRSIKRGVLCGGVVLLCAAVLLLTMQHLGKLASGTVSKEDPRLRVTVDAGHGGFDGGAIAPDGTPEKEINLAVALPLADLLRLFGFDAELTRVDDSGLHEDDEASVRDKKRSDMKARLALYEQADLNIAIHQNMFGDTAYYGAQMFYSANHPLSKVLAASIRDCVYSSMQPDNTRELKVGNRDIYLLYKTTKPTVLVECGFLSNAEELAKLKDETYQHQMAMAVAWGTMVYAGSQEDR